MAFLAIPTKDGDIAHQKTYICPTRPQNATSANASLLGCCVYHSPTEQPCPNWSAKIRESANHCVANSIASPEASSFLIQLEFAY